MVATLASPDLGCGPLVVSPTRQSERQSMARDPHRLPAAANRAMGGAISVLVALFVDRGHARAQLGPEPAHVSALAPDNAVGQEPVNLAPSRRVPAGEKSLTGNPLWTVPLSALSETAARPLFSPSRRPPPPPVAAAPYVPPPKPPPPREPDHPPLTLLGTVVGQAEAIGVFLDEASQDVIRLKPGDVHGGWILRSVRGRETRFESDHREATLALPPRGAGQTAPAVALAGTERGGTCANAPVVGSAPGKCARPGVPIVPAATPAIENSRKLRREI